MLQRWVDHNEVEHRVLDDYERNRILVDLTMQPDDIKTKIAGTIAEGSFKQNPMVDGLEGSYSFLDTGDNASTIADFLSAPYPTKV